jgi:antitoxin component of MazEF toxin-antitoxin module
MTVHRTVKRIGGSLAVIIPRDLAEMMGVIENSSVSLTLVGRQLVIDPENTVEELRGVRSGAASRREVPNARTRAAMLEIGMPRFRDIASLMEDLNAKD